MKTRVISAAVMLVIVAAFVAVSPYTRLFLFLACAVMAVWELSRLLKSLDFHAAPGVIYAVLVLETGLTALGLFVEIDPLWPVAVFVAAAAAAIFAGIATQKIGGRGAMATLFALVYPALPFIIITRLSVHEGWIPVFATAALSTWVCDSFALFGGKLFGRHKAAPAVSPNKTVEGCVCGAVSSLAAGAIVYLILKQWFAIPLTAYLITAFAASTLGQIGDLAASLFKRMAGVKDYSNLIPGHGGMLDRADSLLFSIPTAYFCFYIAGLI